MVDDAHAAAAEFAQDLVPGDGGRPARGCATVVTPNGSGGSRSDIVPGVSGGGRAGHTTGGLPRLRRIVES